MKSLKWVVVGAVLHLPLFTGESPPPTLGDTQILGWRLRVFMFLGVKMLIFLLVFEGLLFFP